MLGEKVENKFESFLRFFFRFALIACYKRSWFELFQK